MLTISLTAVDPRIDATVGRIVYVLRGHAAGEDTIIEADVRERFGSPDQAAPMTWCKAPSAADLCQAGEPFPRFLPESLTLTLQAGILQAGTARGAATQSATAW